MGAATLKTTKLRMKSLNPVKSNTAMEISRIFKFPVLLTAILMKISGRFYEIFDCFFYK